MELCQSCKSAAAFRSWANEIFSRNQFPGPALNTTGTVSPNDLRRANDAERQAEALKEHCTCGKAKAKT